MVSATLTGKTSNEVLESTPAAVSLTEELIDTIDDVVSSAAAVSAVRELRTASDDAASTADEVSEAEETNITKAD